jgi:galactonate dehydratase
MRITGVSPRLVDAGDRDWVFVRVDTDQPGLVGWGEASLGWHANAVAGSVADLGPVVIGQDPRRVEHCWQAMYRGRYFKGGIVTMSAISGIDQALWDIKAKALGVPLYELLGGAVRERVGTYRNLGSELGGDSRDPAAWREATLAAIEAGFDAVKVYPLRPGGPLEREPALREAEALVSAVRAAGGDDLAIMVDLHGRASPATAIQLGQRLEPLRPWFYEEPCQPENVAAMAEIARAVSIPIATGERLTTRFEFQPLFDHRACAVVQPNPCYCGGVSEIMKIASLAETHLVSVAPHNPNGPIGTMVSMHVAMAMSGFLTLELVTDDVPWRWEIVDGAPIGLAGHATVGDRPGIGADLIEVLAARHPGGTNRPHLETGPDGEVLDW